MKSKQEIDKLLDEHKALLSSEVRKYSSNLPMIAVQLEAHKLAVDAASSYTPSLGKFSTHLVNSLKKLSRMSTQYGSTVRLPENTQFALNKINKIEKDLESTLGRSPTVSELSDHSGFNVKTVNNLMSSKKNMASFSSLLNTPTMVNNSNDEWLAFVYHDLTSKDKLIFEHTVGFGCKQILSHEELGKKLNIDAAQINKRVNFIGKMVNKGWK